MCTLFNRQIIIETLNNPGAIPDVALDNYDTHDDHDYVHDPKRLFGGGSKLGLVKVFDVRPFIWVNGNLDGLYDNDQVELISVNNAPDPSIPCGIDRVYLSLSLHVLSHSVGK